VCVFVCVCVCVCACVCECLRESAWERENGRVCVYVSACEFVGVNVFVITYISM
jgi:hypothetical protein